MPPDIRVLAARVVPEDFHARYAAHTKTYLYRIHNHPIDSPFDAAYYTRMPKHLDEVRMQAAAQQFVAVLTAFLYKKTLNQAACAQSLKDTVAALNS